MITASSIAFLNPSFIRTGTESVILGGDDRGGVYYYDNTMACSGSDSANRSIYSPLIAMFTMAYTHQRTSGSGFFTKLSLDESNRIFHRVQVFRVHLVIPDRDAETVLKKHDQFQNPCGIDDATQE